MVAGQEKKIEKKTKIVIDDSSGTKVFIDTLLKDNQMTDSIKHKDGKVIYSGDEAGFRPHEDRENVFVTVSSDEKCPGKKVIIINDGR